MALFLGSTEITGVATGDAAVNGGGSGGGGGAEIKTCTVKLESGNDVIYYGYYYYTKCEDGVASLVSVGDSYAVEEIDTFDITLENVVCDSIIIFPWACISSFGEPSVEFDGDAYSDGISSAIQLPYYDDAITTHIFKAPSEQGVTSTITFTSKSGGGW